MMKSIQWAPRGGNGGIPSEISDLLASADGKTRGYGHGPGASTMFGSELGDITVYPGQWVTKYANGDITVTDRKPNAKWYTVVRTYPENGVPYWSGPHYETRAEAVTYRDKLIELEGPGFNFRVATIEIDPTEDTP